MFPLESMERTLIIISTMYRRCSVAFTDFIFTTRPTEWEIRQTVCLEADGFPIRER